MTNRITRYLTNDSREIARNLRGLIRSYLITMDENRAEDIKSELEGRLKAHGFYNWTFVDNLGFRRNLVVPSCEDYTHAGSDARKIELRNKIGGYLTASQLKHGRFTKRQLGYLFRFLDKVSTCNAAGSTPEQEAERARETDNAARNDGVDLGRRRGD